MRARWWLVLGAALGVASFAGLVAAEERDRPALPPAPRGVLNEGPVRNLTLGEAVLMALNGNLQLRAGALDPAIAGSRYRAESAIFDPLLTGSIDYAHNEIPSANLFFGREVVTTDQGTFTGGVEQLLPTGGTVGFLYRLDRAETNNLFSSVNPSWANLAGVEVGQPLLRGAGDVVMANIRRAHNDVVASREAQRALREQTILQVVVAYWDLARAQEQVVARRMSETTATELLRDAEARLAARVGTPLDVYDATSGVEQRRGARYREEGILASLQDSLRAQILPFAPDDISGVNFVATDPVGRPALSSPTHAKLERYVGIALKSRPEIKATKAGLASRNVDVTQAANAVLPQLDVVAGLGSQSLKSGLAESVGDMFRGKAITGTVGLQFSMFVGQRAAKSNLRLAEWARRQSVIQFKDLENQVVNEVRQAIRELITAQAVEGAARAQVIAAQEDLRGERHLLDNGKSTPFNVLLKEERRTDARLTLATASTTVRQAAAAFWRSVGMLGQTLGVGNYGGGR